MKIDAIHLNETDRFFKFHIDNQTAKELANHLNDAYKGKEMPEIINKLVFFIEEELLETTK
jgi:hypothetical protein